MPCPRCSANCPKMLRSILAPVLDASIDNSTFWAAITGAVIAITISVKATRSERIRSDVLLKQSNNLTAFEVGCVFRVSLPLVVSVLRISTQWPAAPRKGFASCDHRRWRRSLLDPVDDRTQQIKLIQRLASATVAHPGNEIELAPLGYGVEAAVSSGHILVIAECSERRKPRVAIAVVEDQFSSVRREGRQVGGHRVHERLDGRKSFLINIHRHVSGRRSKNTGSGREQSPQRGTVRDACVVKEAGIDLGSTRGLRPAKGPLDGGSFFRSQTGVVLFSLACQHLGIEITGERIGDQAVGEAVFGVTLLHEGIFDQLSVVVSNGLLDDGFPVRIFRSNLIEGNRNPSAD